MAETALDGRTDRGAVLDPDTALVELYAAHYTHLVRTAALLLQDPGAAEEVVQDAFVSMHAAWRRLRDPDKAAAYLRRSVVNGARSRLRHRQVVARHLPKPVPDAPSAEYDALAGLERVDVMHALAALPRRQREVLVLRYYADMPEIGIAETLGISVGAVKSHVARAFAALRSTLEQL